MHCGVLCNTPEDEIRSVLKCCSFCFCVPVTLSQWIKLTVNRDVCVFFMLCIVSRLMLLAILLIHYFITVYLSGSSDCLWYAWWKGEMTACVHGLWEYQYYPMFQGKRLFKCLSSLLIHQSRISLPHWCAYTRLCPYWEIMFYTTFLILSAKVLLLYVEHKYSMEQIIRSVCLLMAKSWRKSTEWCLSIWWDEFISSTSE